MVRNLPRKKAEACPGCRYNRYNQPAGYREGPRDAPVSGEGCWHLERIYYDRKLKRYVCTLNR